MRFPGELDHVPSKKARNKTKNFVSSYANAGQMARKLIYSETRFGAVTSNAFQSHALLRTRVSHTMEHRWPRRQLGR